MLRHFAVERSIRAVARPLSLMLPALLIGLFFGSLSVADAQDDTNPAPRAADSQIDTGIAPRRDRSGLGVPDMRVPTVDRQTGDIVDPQMDQILLEWSEHTKKIRTIQGRHMRAIFDWQFKTETRAQGEYYVAMPDMGRIDIEKYTGTAKKTDRQKDPSGVYRELAMEDFNQPQRWICNGKDIKIIDDAKKTYDVVPIPESQQGVNMMDGPLPFLFGMPPDKAKARYHFKLIEPGRDPETWWIEVRPKTRGDAAEWRRAFLVLSRKTYLPKEVDLFDSGSKQTVYLFGPPEVNKQRLLPTFMVGDPFNPSLTWYRREVHSGGSAPPGGGGVTPAGAFQVAQGPSLKMPFFLDAPGREAKQRGEELKRQGFQVEYRKGPHAQRPEQEFRVADQSPPPMAPIKPGRDRIILIYYDRMDHRTAFPPHEGSAVQ